MQIVNESDRGNDLVVLPYLPRQVERQIVMIGICFLNLLKTGSISRLRASCQQLDSESDEKKQLPFDLVYIRAILTKLRIIT